MKVLKKALVLLMFFHMQKNDSHSGRTVKKLQFIKKALVLYCFLMFLGEGPCDFWPAGRPGRVTLCVCFCVPTLLNRYENP